MPHPVARVAAAAAVLATGLLAACSAASDDSATSSAPPANTSSAADTGAASSSAPAPPTSSAPHEVRRCTGKELKVTLGEPEGAAGSIQLTVGFTNNVQQSCTLQGYPGLDALDASGKVIVHAARAPGPAPTLTLAPGDVASALISWQDDGKMSTSMALTPPNTTATTQYPVRVGVTNLQIQTVRAGTGS